MQIRENHRGKKKKPVIDRNGLFFRLYGIFVGFTIAIVLIIGIVQTIVLKNQTRQDTLNALEDTAQNISATYGTSAYENAIRSVIYSGEYVVRSVTEDGKILIDTERLSVYRRWPDIEVTIGELIDQLDVSPGSFYLVKKDTENVTWVIYGQLLANWDGTREILLVAENTNMEKMRVYRQLLFLLAVGAGIFMISIFLSAIVAKMYVKPIQGITKQAEDLAKGNFDQAFLKSSYTELNTLSDTLNLAADSMMNFEKNRRDMVAHVSHDMRTPLTMIKAYAEMIQTISGDDPEKRNQHLQIIIDQSDRLSEFVNQSLDLSRLQSRVSVLERREFSLGMLIRSMVASIRLIDQEEHEFRLYIDGDTMIYADVNRVEQIIQNLVNNSRKYGGRVIEIHAHKLEEHKVRLEIVDFGEGIAKEKLPFIWTKYYRIKPYGKDTQSASVGLSIVKEIADMHGIAYGVESDVDAGARFWFDFPTEKEAENNKSDK